MDFPSFDYEPTRIFVRVDDTIGPCDMIRFRDGRHFIVLDWVRTHDGDVPKQVIEIDHTRLSPFKHSECKYVLNGQLSMKDAKQLPDDLDQ